MNAADVAKQADAMLAEKELEMKELEAQKRRARDIMFKKTQQLTKMMDTETEIKMEIHGAKTGIKNLSSRMKKLDQESIKSQEIIYNQDFNIAQLERRIARMQGEVNNEEKQGTRGLRFLNLHKSKSFNFWLSFRTPAVHWVMNKIDFNFSGPACFHMQLNDEFSLFLTTSVGGPTTLRTRYS